MKLTEKTYLTLSGLVDAEYLDSLDHASRERSFMACAADVGTAQAALISYSYWRERADEMRLASIELDAIYQQSNSHEAGK